MEIIQTCRKRKMRGKEPNFIAFKVRKQVKAPNPKRKVS